MGTNSKGRIMLIEDEEILIDVLQKKLITEGYDVLVARNGEEGIQKLKETRDNPPDLILLDIIMPKKDGFAVLEAIRKDKKLAPIPVIIISNSGQPVELSRAKELGAKDWLVKTEFDPQDVMDKVQKYINKNNQ